VIMFYDTESLWSMTAHYNRQRLLNAASPKGTTAVTANR
jgi:hypothetical protein